MREDVIREVIGRLLTDDDFRQAVQQTPYKALKDYQLNEEELSAISSADSGNLGIGRLETRISAATSAPLMEDPPDGCGCVNAPPPTPCNKGGGSPPPPPPPPPKFR